MLADELPKDDPKLLGTMEAELEVMTYRWSTFCLFLGVKKHKLDRIEEQMTTEMYFQNMLASWITENDKQATIHKILEALKSPLIENNALAQRLRDSNRHVQEMLKRKTPPSLCG